LQKQLNSIKFLLNSSIKFFALYSHYIRYKHKDDVTDVSQY